MDSINAIICDPRYHDILAILKGARNGLVYGAKVRFPHALVMSILFHGGRPLKDRLKFVLKATKQHALNLSKFVTIYKTALLVQRKMRDGKEKIFGERNAINEQIVLYCVSRVVSSLLPRPSSQSTDLRSGLDPSKVGVNSFGMPNPPGYPYPQSVPPSKKVFEIYAALTWGAVMWLFRWRRHALHGGLVNSMQYLYLDSEVWTNLKNFLWRECFCNIVK
ncbi:peroxisomal membrane protein PMP 24 [Phakopsora pachyrhizi]|uniref:Peroxisomal membrane protein PMP 24 n=1 Tax=Phakopsora pachyrhizi TaxID=170000 RepID=A0AAV0BUZ0_PHAPC|nr:peroxisomal membrane protein PMP 24 [Phakopsora pachyrhizi]